LKLGVKKRKLKAEPKKVEKKIREAAKKKKKARPRRRRDGTFARR
jgi:hypothetical protein